MELSTKMRSTRGSKNKSQALIPEPHRYTIDMLPLSHGTKGTPLLGSQALQRFFLHGLQKAHRLRHTSDKPQKGREESLARLHFLSETPTQKGSIPLSESCYRSSISPLPARIGLQINPTGSLLIWAEFCASSCTDDTAHFMISWDKAARIRNYDNSK
ncbi:hypothetical protein GOP47_0000025 [Adiantum capillus-veneris]|uniref:Uncharacterized protein n=1 Tax=Adiantum capillus-veneris TaxID=13818 RepID=A0A9D4VDX3_ADICA|nr:hypothetical protein GOP47_0000025 [Adiantum capillus-veneris]